MTTPGEPTDPYGPPPEGQPPYGQAPYGQPPYGQAPYGQAPFGQAPHGQPAYGPPPGGYPAPWIPDAMAPYGRHPVTGAPYSDKSKVVAGVLQLVLPFGVGRFYMGDTQTGVLQLVVAVLTCGIGGLWSFIDGILILTGNPVDAYQRPLRG